MMATASPIFAITRARRAAYSSGGKTSVKTGCAARGSASANASPRKVFRYNSGLSMPTSTLSTVGPFVNEPFTDYRKPENLRGMREAIEKVRTQLGREYDLVIGGKHIRTQDKIVSINPANPAQVNGLHHKTGLGHL